MTNDMTGWTKRQRAERRRFYDNRAVAAAQIHERSLKCANYGLHAGQPNGCTNGQTCLCECHDPEES